MLHVGRKELKKTLHQRHVIYQLKSLPGDALSSSFRLDLMRIVGVMQAVSWLLIHSLSPVHLSFASTWCYYQMWPNPELERIIESQPSLQVRSDRGRGAIWALQISYKQLKFLWKREENEHGCAPGRPHATARLVQSQMTRKCPLFRRFTFSHPSIKLTATQPDCIRFCSHFTSLIPAFCEAIVAKGPVLL